MLDGEPLVLASAKCPRCVYYLLFRKVKTIFPMDLHAEIVTLTKTRAKKRKFFMPHNGPNVHKYFSDF